MVTLPEETPSPQDQSHSSINNKNKYYCCFWLYLKSQKQTNITTLHNSHNLAWPHYYQLLLRVRNAKWIPFEENIYSDIDMSVNWNQFFKLYMWMWSGWTYTRSWCMYIWIIQTERSQKPRYIIYWPAAWMVPSLCFQCTASTGIVHNWFWVVLTLLWMTTMVLIILHIR